MSSHNWESRVSMDVRQDCFSTLGNLNEFRERWLSLSRSWHHPWRTASSQIKSAHSTYDGSVYAYIAINETYGSRCKGQRSSWLFAFKTFEPLMMALIVYVRCAVKHSTPVLLIRHTVTIDVQRNIPRDHQKRWPDVVLHCLLHPLWSEIRVLKARIVGSEIGYNFDGGRGKFVAPFVRALRDLYNK